MITDRRASTEDRGSAEDVPAGPSSRFEKPRGLAPCLAYLFVEFARPMDWVTPLRVIRPGMIVSIWGFIWVLRRSPLRIPKPLWYMFGLCALMAWNVPLAVNNAWAFWGFRDYSFLVLGCVLPLALLPANLAAVRLLLHAYVFFHLPVAVHGLLFHGAGLSGWMGDENDLALALNAALGVAVYLFLEASSKTKKMMLLATIGVLVSGVAATLSRGGFVGLAAVGAYLLVVGPHRGRVVLAVLLAILCLYAFAPPAYWEEVRSIETATDEGDTGSQRLYFWGIAWRMFLDHPVTGVGTRNYGIRAPEYEDRDMADLVGQHIWGRVAHSLYFTLLPEQGTIGTILFLGVVLWSLRTWRALRRAHRASPEDPESRSLALLASAALAGIVAVLVTGAFLSVLYYPVLWVLVGLLAALDRVSSLREAETV